MKLSLISTFFIQFLRYHSRFSLDTQSLFEHFFCSFLGYSSSPQQPCSIFLQFSLLFVVLCQSVQQVLAAAGVNGSSSSSLMREYSETASDSSSPKKVWKSSSSLANAWCSSERTLWLISIHGNKNSYQKYLATLCKIIIKLNKVTTIDVRDRSVGATWSKGWILGS